MRAVKEGVRNHVMVISNQGMAGQMACGKLTKIFPDAIILP